MNKLVEWAVDKFVNFDYGNAIKKRNSDVIYQKDDDIIWGFHGNTIAKGNLKNSTVTVSLAGWPTKSTMERLNSLLQRLGLKGTPFQHYGTQRFEAKPTFYDTSISSTEQIVIKLSDIQAGVYDVRPQVPYLQ